MEYEPGKWMTFVVGPESPDWVPFAEISPHLVNSIMTTEDSGFFKHHGFISSEFRSALQQNLQRGYFRLGASSITMQMVKNVLLSREKTLSRKLQEMFLTWYVEHHLTKERIMEIYFNVIEFGPGIYGIGRAARHYFGKTAKELEPQEAAWFSSILPNPKRRYVQYCHANGHARRQVGRVHQAHHAAHARARPAHRRRVRQGAWRRRCSSRGPRRCRSASAWRSSSASRRRRSSSRSRSSRRL